MIFEKPLIGVIAVFNNNKLFVYPIVISYFKYSKLGTNTTKNFRNLWYINFADQQTTGDHLSTINFYFDR